MPEYIRCPDCGGFVDTGSCCCKLARAVKNALMKHLEIDEEELDRRLGENEIWPVNMKYMIPEEERESITFVPITFRPEKLCDD